jgi:hypothetical protein
MKLLVCTQTVDTQDPALGFFHRWLEELANDFERIIRMSKNERTALGVSLRDIVLRDHALTTLVERLFRA